MSPLERALRILHNDFNMQFEVLLKRTDEQRVHTKNLQKLMLQIFKCLSGENPSFMWTFFERKHLTYELRNKNLLQLPKRCANKIGANSLIFKGALLWNTLPDTIKNAASTAIFKRMIKGWSGQNCTCKICS